MIVLQSNQDASVNFISEVGTGYFESRYVRRPGSPYFIAYLSSQSGCNRGCRMCHLTTTGQTRYIDANYDALKYQLLQVMKHYIGQPPAEFCHINFMARGEPLSNKYLLADGDRILVELCEFVAKKYNLPVRVNISTIMPLTWKQPLRDIFRYSKPHIYYSLYSVNEDFRQKWLPGAMKPYDAVRQLRDYEEVTNLPPRIHHAFIRDENDSLEDVSQWAYLVSAYLPQSGFNLVRYNPPGPGSCESEPKVITRNMELLEQRLGGPVRIVDRVGFDVHASCGTFFPG